MKMIPNRLYSIPFILFVELLLYNNTRNYCAQHKKKKNENKFNPNVLFHKLPHHKHGGNQRYSTIISVLFFLLLWVTRGKRWVGS